ncbi:hypothetical protein ANO14919_079730 [Xylariales sp. No.14919]|nr:hypothetical protein ANO14919_079730 [Xylariales sp. No.14919]
MEDADVFAGIWASEGNSNEGHLQLDSDLFAYQHESVASQPRAPGPHFKLRSSCDACGQAKTKCDRTRPACLRCISQGVKCVYGVSRKSGKPPRRRPPIASPGEPDTTGTNVDLIFHLAEGAPATNPDFSASNLGFQAQFPYDGLGDIGALTPSRSDQGTTGLTWRCGPTATRKPVESSGTPSAATDATASRHSCAQESKAIMRVLYCANPSTPIPDGVLARTLDLGSVLTRNRDVVGRLELLLKCPCARSPHMALLYASIVSRMLLWYRQATWSAAAVGASSLSSVPPVLAVQEPTSVSSDSIVPKAGVAETADDKRSGVSVLAMPVTVGNFQTDDRNLQTALTNCLLLNELGKVGGLIERFISIAKSELRVSDSCPMGEGLGACLGDAALIASLGAWLRTEYEDVFKMARSGLSLLHESLPEPSQ